MNKAEAQLRENLAECRYTLGKIGIVVDILDKYADVDKIDFALAGSYGHLAELLKEAHAFITSSESDL